MKHTEQSQMTGSGWQEAIQVAKVKEVPTGAANALVTLPNCLLFNKTANYKFVTVVCAMADKLPESEVDESIEIVIAPYDWSPVIVKGVYNNTVAGELQYGY